MFTIPLFFKLNLTELVYVSLFQCEKTMIFKMLFCSHVLVTRKCCHLMSGKVEASRVSQTCFFTHIYFNARVRLNQAPIVYLNFREIQERVYPGYRYWLTTLHAKLHGN